MYFSVLTWRASGVEQHDIPFLHSWGCPLKIGDIDQAAIRDVDPPDDAGPVEPLERNLVDGRPIFDEVPGCIKMGAMMNNHLHLGHVGAMLRDRRFLADTWLRKRRDARELFRNPMREVDEGAERAGYLGRR